MSDCCKTKVMDGVIIQENGIIRNAKGYLIGRLAGDVAFDSEHIVEEKPETILGALGMLLDCVNQHGSDTGLKDLEELEMHLKALVKKVRSYQSMLLSDSVG